MELYPVAAVFVFIWLLLTIRNSDNGLVMAIAVIPFGMFAAFRIGGLSIILSHLIAVLTIGALIIRFFSQRGRAPLVQLPISSLYLCFFSVYAVFSALIIVRIFEGQFLVFPLNVTFNGSLVSAYFPSTMVPLQPSKSNISQSFYVVLSTLFFIAIVLVVRRRGLAFAETGLVWAASLNVLLGAMDLAQLDSILQFIRTADYSLNNHHTIAGVSRIIGGYPEASVFSAVSATFFAYFFTSFLIGHRVRDAVLALANLICALLALSSTGVLSIAVASLLILLHFSVLPRVGMSRQFAQSAVISTAIIVIAIITVFLLTTAKTFTSQVLDILLFSKSTSLSGLERAAWAESGYNAFFQTWGLGAGTGSIRANGLFAVLLGNVGLPGTLAFVMFLVFGVGKSIPACGRNLARTFYSGRVAALTLLSSMLVSATVPDPTLLLVFFVGISSVSRDVATARSSATEIRGKSTA